MSIAQPLYKNGKDYKARFDTKLIAFCYHKNALLNYLRSQHQLGPKSQPFNSATSWSDLTDFASFYFSRQERHRLPTKRGGALREIAKALGQAHRLASSPARDEVDSDLVKAACAQAKISPDLMSQINSNQKRPLRSVAFSLAAAGWINERIRDLSLLEAIARRAVNDERVRRGRPKGSSVLPSWDAIVALARIYRRSTDGKPAAGTGSFSKFAHMVFIALGEHNVKHNSLVEAIKRARLQARAYATRHGGLSPFS
jgi:hypothetical protein